MSSLLKAEWMVEKTLGLRVLSTPRGISQLGVVCQEGLHLDLCRKKARRVALKDRSAVFNPFRITHFQNPELPHEHGQGTALQGKPQPCVMD